VYYRWLGERTTIRFLDLQSFFLYSFTLGVNRFSSILLDPADIADLHLIPSEEILSRHFPIRGPEWLTNAANAEMRSVEDVFCDFQNELLVPIGKTPSADNRLFPDAFAGALLWAYFGGIYWLEECVDQICNCISLAGTLDDYGVARYQVKKTMQLIENEDIQRVLALRDVYRREQED
jgi:hypothetical protein